LVICNKKSKAPFPSSHSSDEVSHEDIHMPSMRSLEPCDQAINCCTPKSSLMNRILCLFCRLCWFRYNWKTVCIKNNNFISQPKI